MMLTELSDVLLFWSGPDGFRHPLDEIDRRAEAFGGRWRRALLVATDGPDSGEILVCGTLVRDALGFDAQGVPLEALWAEEDRSTLRWVLDGLQGDPGAVLIAAMHGGAHPMEWLAMPLLVDDAPSRHALVYLAQASVVAPKARPEPLRLVSLRIVAPSAISVVDTEAPAFGRAEGPLLRRSSFQILSSDAMTPSTPGGGRRQLRIVGGTDVDACRHD